MPELPEVETVKRTLNELIQGKTIQEVEVRLPRIIQRPDDVQQFSSLLTGRTFERIERRGKFLRMLLDGIVLLSHLRMEGRYGVYQADEPIEKHTHVIFHFTDQSQLRYQDVRQFGTMHLFEPGEEWKQKPLKNLGPEPLDPNFTIEHFVERLQGRTANVKSVLLNQAVLVGLGNIYVDESLFKAKIHPEKSVSALTEQEIERLFLAIRKTLSDAVKQGGTSVKSYVNGRGEMGMFQQQLLVYGRKAEGCMECGTPVERIVVGGRGTHFCPVCQIAK